MKLESWQIIFYPITLFQVWIGGGDIIAVDVFWLKIYQSLNNWNTNLIIIRLKYIINLTILL